MGAALVAYAVIYAAHTLFNPFYSAQVSASDVYRVMNYFTAVGILISIGMARRRVLDLADPDRAPAQASGARTSLYAGLALGILFFTLWFRLLSLDAGESVSVAEDVAWFAVAVANPLVLGSTGINMWRSGITPS